MTRRLIREEKWRTNGIKMKRKKVENVDQRRMMQKMEGKTQEGSKR